MIAGLPMYERAETAAAHDILWHAIRDALRDDGLGAPDELTRDIDPWDLWRHPDLVLAQTCGLPFRARLHGQVALVGTPDYGLPDSPPGYYRSVLAVRAGDQRADVAEFAGATLAYNDPLSQSGWAAVAALDVPFAAKLQTGAHLSSARAVAEGRADIAGIDAVTWRLIQRYDPSLAAKLRVLDRTPPTPGLPFICARTRDPDRTARAIGRALSLVSQDTRNTLGLRALVPIPAATYLALPRPPAP